MTTSESSTSFVEDVSDSEITIVCHNELAAQRVKALGARRSLLTFKKWKLHYSSEDELAFNLTALRDQGFAMAGAPAGWPPAAVFEQLRDHGKTEGTFTEIIWSQPGHEVLSEK